MTILGSTAQDHILNRSSVGRRTKLDETGEQTWLRSVAGWSSVVSPLPLDEEGIAVRFMGVSMARGRQGQGQGSLLASWLWDGSDENGSSDETTGNRQRRTKTMKIY